MTVIKCSAFVRFGTVPAPARDISELDVLITNWTLNWTSRALCLTLVHRGAIFHFVTYGHDDEQVTEADKLSFGQALLDAVHASWPPSCRVPSRFPDLGDWKQRDSVDLISTAVSEREDQLLDLIVGALPGLARQASTHDGCGLQGSNLWIEVEAQQSGSSEPTFTLIGDCFQIAAEAELFPALGAEHYAHINRIDLSDVTRYLRPCIGPQGLVRNHLHLVTVESLGSAHEELVFKTLSTSPPPPAHFRKRWKRVPAWSNQSICIGELDVLTTMPPHPNVIPTPLAIVITGEDNRLVGWIQKRYGPFIPVHRPSADDDTWMRCLRSALDVCKAVQHLGRHDFVHPDLSVNNLVHDVENDRVVVIDFQPHAVYSNQDGPAAPEAAGHWDVSTHERQDGTVVVAYSRCEQPVSRVDTIISDWEGVPQIVFERLAIFTLGCVLSLILDLRIVFNWVPTETLSQSHVQRIRRPLPGEDARRDAWERQFPAPVLAVVERCCTFDPRSRPTIAELVTTIEHHVQQPRPSQ